jgi:hypothetical protein
MTISDDSDLRLLERDLWQLAEPREDDERVRAAVREQLAAGLQPRRRRRPSRRLALGSIAAAAAAATIALVTIVGTTGSGGPAAADAAIVHHALNAVTPPADAILHVKVVGVQNGVGLAAETWQQTSPPYASRGVKGQVGHQGEFGDNGTTSFQFDPATNTIYEQPDSSRPTFRDPISQIRREIAQGRAHYDGTAVIDGVSLYKIDLPQGMVGYFDRSDYRPRYLDDPQRDGSVVRLRVVAYGYLPITASNRGLLSVTAQHPNAGVEAAGNVGTSSSASGK